MSIDEKKYGIADKNKTRLDLNLPCNKKIIFFGAVRIAEKQKGYIELIEAFKILSKKIEDSTKIHLAIAGNISPDYNEVLPFSYTSLGYLNYDNLSKAFQSADVFVSPSIEDSGPMMVNQSIMSGTPVVAFEMGVALDLVHNGVTGYRAKYKDCNEFAEGIFNILELDNASYIQMSNKCRELGLKLCHQKVQSSMFMKLFEELIRN